MLKATYNAAEMCGLAGERYFLGMVDAGPNGSGGAADDLRETACSALEAVTEWTPHRIQAALEASVELSRLPRRDAYAVIRIAITGRNVSPPLFELLTDLGRRRAIGLMQAARHH